MACASMGPVGAGSAMKAVNNALLAVNILAVGEGLAALVKAGVPARKAVDGTQHGVRLPGVVVDVGGDM